MATAPSPLPSPLLTVDDLAADRQRRRARRLSLARRTGLFGDDLAGTRIIRACTGADLARAYRLVHDTFVDSGYIHPHPSNMRLRPFEALSQMATFIARAADGRVVGVLSIVEDTPELGLPSDGAFRAEIDTWRREGVPLAEITNQAMEPTLRGTSVTTELIRAVYAHAEVAGIGRIIASVSPGHADFYDLIGFHGAGPIRSYSSEIEDPVALLRCDFDLFRSGPPHTDDERFMHQYLFDGNPHRAYARGWNVLARMLFRQPDALRSLFIEQGRLLETCSDAQCEAIVRHWGEDTFARVMNVAAEPRVA